MSVERIPRINCGGESALRENSEIARTSAHFIRDLSTFERKTFRGSSSAALRTLILTVISMITVFFSVPPQRPGRLIGRHRTRISNGFAVFAKPPSAPGNIVLISSELSASPPLCAAAIPTKRQIRGARARASSRRRQNPPSICQSSATLNVDGGNETQNRAGMK